MHEYALTRQIIQTAEAHAERHGARRVLAIDLVVGDLSGCVADCILLYFDLIAAESICAGAALRVERVAPKLRCQRCGELFTRKPFSFACPRAGCDGEGRPTPIGREFYIRAIHVESRNPEEGAK